MLRDKTPSSLGTEEDQDKDDLMEPVIMENEVGISLLFKNLL